MSEPLEPNAAATKLFSLLSPELVQRSESLRAGKTLLAHYTSAENALNIINGQQFWLRNVRCMNDFSEVDHGINLLIRVFHANDGERRNRLYSLFDNIAVGAAKSAIDDFDKLQFSLKHDAYIGCLSEFDPDDDEGRLSMWRAYGSHGKSVALVMNSTPFLAETDVLKAYSIPALYLTDAEFTARIDAALDEIEENIELFKILNEKNVRHLLFYWLIFLSLGLKHRGFREEKEWRIVYLPKVEKSPTIHQSVETISGIPQIVQKVPLENAPEKGLHEANIANLIARILIGPTDYPVILFDAFEQALSERGVVKPSQYIKVSSIPLR